MSSPASYRKPLSPSVHTNAGAYNNSNQYGSPPQRALFQNGPQSPPQHRRVASNASSIASLAPNQIAAYTSPKSVLESYRGDIASNFENEPARFNPSNVARPNSSPALDMRDPIQMHLLVETALDDAREYEILAPDEVDELKRAVKSLESRVEITRRALAAQSKYRDAAVNMAKLYGGSPGQGEGVIKRVSMGLNRRSHSEQIREAERERVNSERRCEELAMELWGLEKRLMEPKQRLLSHTAGVLQLTHKGPRNGDGRPQMPGSPESMATYSNFRNSLEAVKINHDLFDDRHLYKEFDRLDGFGMDGSRGGGDPEADKRLAETQNKLDQLCHRLREVVIKTLPQREDAYNRPPHISSTEPAGQHLDEQLRYLDQNIDVIDSEQDAIMRKHDEADRAMEETIGDLNREVRSLLLPFDGSMPEPPDLTGRSLKQQLLYFQSTINTVESELRRAELTRSQAPSFGGDDSNIQASLERVWNSIQESEADERRRRHQRRQTMLDNGQEPDEDEISDLDAPAEPFSVLAFTAKVQDLYRSATRLKDQKDVLTRQIKQQRELNNKSDATRDREQAQLEAELKESRDAFNRLQDQSDQLQAELMDIMEKLDKLRAGSDLWKAEKEKLEEETKELRDVLLERNEEIEGLEEQLDELKLSKSAASAQQMERAEQKIEDLTRQLSSAESRIAELTQDLTEKGKSSQELALAEGRIKDLTSELASARETIAALQDKLDDTESSTRSDLARSSSRIQELEKTIADLQTNSTKSSGLQKALVEQEQAVSNLHDALDQKEQQLENATKALQTARKETEDATLELARLQTELTISRAELDGAYGTRAERAADIAANPLVQKEIDALLNSNMKLQEEVQGKEGRVEELKRELGGLVEEYEGLVREGVEWEGERRRLEAEIDKLREEREGLEEKLGEERVKWLGVGAGAASPLGSPRVSQGPGSVTGGREMTSTSVLKNEFKKMMRDTRAESARALRGLANRIWVRALPVVVPDDRITNTSICTGGFTSGPSDSVSRMIDGIGNCEIGFRGRGMTLLSDMITDAIDEVTAADLDDLRRAFDARNRSAAVFDRSAEETDGVTAASVRIPAFKTRKRSMTLLSDLITNAIDETEAYDIPRTPAFYWRTEPHTRVGWKVEHVRSLSDWSIDEELLHTEARKRHWMKKH